MKTYHRLHPLRIITAIVFTVTGVCAANAAPDFSGKSDDSIKQVLQAVARHQLTELADGDYTPVATMQALNAARPPKGIQWNYALGVTLYGMLRASDFLEDKTYREYVHRHNEIVGRYFNFLSETGKIIGAENEAWKKFLNNRARSMIGRLMLLGNLDNSGSMGAAVLEAVSRSPERNTDGQRAVLEQVAGWIVKKQHRLPDGTFWRPDRTDVDEKWSPGTLWIDDLYMSSPFLARWARYTDDPSHLDDAARQIINMAALMQDKDGLWFHGYSVPAKQHSRVKWSRGNGWAILATVEVLSAMPDDHPLRGKLLDILRRHIDGLKPLQAPSGFWRQTLDKPGSWDETSGTAMFAYAIARAANRGWIPADDMAIARKAFAAVCTKITPDGKVNGICEGTKVSLKVEYYETLKAPDDETRGRGAVLLAGAEILAAGKKK